LPQRPQRPAAEAEIPEPPAAVRPGALSELLREMAHAPAVPLDTGWDRHLRSGAVVGRFELLRELGRGGFGIVYEARDTELGRRVAFKALKPGTLASGHDAGWLRDEAEAIARLQHPNLVTLFDAGQGPSGPYLILELIEGETLEERLGRGPLPPAEALRIARAIAAGLAHAHAAGVVHRDLKPGNVLLGPDGGVKLLDFGLAHVFGREGIEGGTRAFMAPEQRRGADSADPAVDVYALGVLLHLLLTGALPPEGAGRVPPAFRVPLARLLVEDPARRPADGAEALDLLDGVARALVLRPHGLRRTLLAVAASGMVVGGIVAAALHQWAAPLQSLTVAVADLQNTTGDPDLDALSGLVIASLEQSKRLRVVTRSRARDLLAQLGREAKALGEADAREAALRADAGALVTGRVRRDAGGYRLELRGIDPRTGKELFTSSAQAARKEDVLRAIDAATADARRELRESEADLRASDVQVAQAVTGSLEAWRHYAAGKECADRPSLTGTWQIRLVSSCAAEFDRAIAIDPGFALAYYQLALLADTESVSAGSSSFIASAMRNLDRAPWRDQQLIRAYDARISRRDSEALALYAAVIDASPDDKEPVGLAGELLHHAGRFADAVPFFERALELDPQMEWPLDHLPEDLGALGEMDRLRSLVHRWERAQPTPGVLHALSLSFSWLGEHDRAIATARQAVDIAGSGALEDLVNVLVAGERYAEAEQQLAPVVAAGPSAPIWALNDLARTMRLQGRHAEALSVIARFASLSPPEPGVVEPKLLQLEMGSQRKGAAQEACAATKQYRAPAVLCAPALAYQGALAEAEADASSLPGGSAGLRLYHALALWRGGRSTDALMELRALDRDHPVPFPFGLVAPSFFIAELAFESGLQNEALRAARRFQRLRIDGLWRGWAYPRSLVLSAHAAEQLGLRDEALADVRHVLKMLSRADAGDPDVAAARELERRLTAAPP
jgi:tetratricopeptide (TPR) repeat protein